MKSVLIGAITSIGSFVCTTSSLVNTSGLHSRASSIGVWRFLINRLSISCYHLINAWYEIFLDAGDTTIETTMSLLVGFLAHACNVFNMHCVKCFHLWAFWQGFWCMNAMFSTCVLWSTSIGTRDYFWHRSIFRHSFFRKSFCRCFYFWKVSLLFDLESGHSKNLLCLGIISFVSLYFWARLIDQWVSASIYWELGTDFV